MNYKEIAKNRLTCKSVKDGSWTVKGCKTTIQTLIDRLAELEDKIEEGILIELPRNKIKIRDDKDADWNSQNFPKGSGGPYDYDYKGEE